MGYTHTPRTFSLVFTGDHPLAGLEAEVGSLSIGALMDLELVLSAQPETVAEAVANMRRAVAMFAAALRSWNLADAAGQPVPVTVEAVDAQDSGLIMRLVAEWRQALVSVPPPLQNGSGPSPSTELEASLPMEPLPASHLS